MKKLTFTVPAGNAEEMIAVGEALAKNLRGGEVIELLGDLGAGKTTFVKGLAKGLRTDEATSPSFTINNLYEGPRLSLSHYDFYRLSEMGIMGEELKESIAEPGMVTVVEWGGVASGQLPEERVTIEISPTGNGGRHLEFRYPAGMAYLFEGFGGE